MYKEYLKLLGEVPEFLDKYLKTPSILRLKNVGYFCGMDYASKDIYDFSEYISRFDHSLSVSLLTYKLTHDKVASIAALYHDVATPCFSHVIDYMNKDYEKQESTEELTKDVIYSDYELKELLKEDNIDIEDIINFKKYSIVDNDRPKLCADRLDGVILNSIGWTKNITYNQIKKIIDSICIFINEDNEKEIGFNNMDVASDVLELAREIDVYCHMPEDNYMMELLAKITRYSILNRYISYLDLYVLGEKEIFNILESTNDDYLNRLLYIFKTVKKDYIKKINIDNIKVRKLNPIVNNKRLLTKIN